jgi:hypothetical protein
MRAPTRPVARTPRARVPARTTTRGVAARTPVRRPGIPQTANPPRSVPVGQGGAPRPAQSQGLTFPNGERFQTDQGGILRSTSTGRPAHGTATIGGKRYRFNNGRIVGQPTSTTPSPTRPTGTAPNQQPRPAAGSAQPPGGVTGAGPVPGSGTGPNTVYLPNNTIAASGSTKAAALSAARQLASRSDLRARVKIAPGSWVTYGTLWRGGRSSMRGRLPKNMLERVAVINSKVMGGGPLGKFVLVTSGLLVSGVVWAYSVREDKMKQMPIDEVVAEGGLVVSTDPNGAAMEYTSPPPPELIAEQSSASAADQTRIPVLFQNMRDPAAAALLVRNLRFMVELGGSLATVGSRRRSSKLMTSVVDSLSNLTP